MIGGSQPGGHGGRSLDAEVNLVPFIDLLSMCICFLLMTAVWIQIAGLHVKQSHGTEAADTAGKIDMEVRMTSQTGLEYVLKQGNKVIKKQTVQAATLAEFLHTLDTTLNTVPEIGTAMITPQKDVSYGDLISVMDTLRKHHIVNMGIVPTGGQR